MANTPAFPRPRSLEHGLSTVHALAAIPEEEVWLAKQKSPRTRRAYRQDVEHFMRVVRISSREELRSIDHKAVIAWERYMRETEGAQSSTIRRRLAALSSLFRHLVKEAIRHAAPSPSPTRILSMRYELNFNLLSVG